MLPSFVRPSVRPTQGSCKQRCTIDRTVLLSDVNELGKIPMGSPLTEASNTGGGGLKSAVLDQYLSKSQKRYKLET